MTEPLLRDDQAILPGSFDPPTRGHFDVIRRAAPLFARLVVAVVENPEKRSLFSADERVELIQRELIDLSHVEIVSFRGLTVDLAVRVGARWIVRGIRSAVDVGYELPMAHSNQRCGRAEIETLFLPTTPGLAFVSSTLVRQIALEGGRLEEFVTPAVAAALHGKANGR